MKKIFLIVFVLALSFSGCEKDDICDASTNTTPRLVIDFYDNTDPTLTKNLINLKVIGDGMPEGIVFNESGTPITKYLTSGSSIKIPLKLTTDSTKYSLILNSNATDPSLIFTDVLEFNYSRKTLFVSRACGYKVLFDLNTDITLPNAFVLNANPATNEGNWIKDIVVEKYNLENENETHIKIYF